MGSTENTYTTERRFGTLAVHAGAPHDPVTGAVIAPVGLICRNFEWEKTDDELLDFLVYYICPDERWKSCWPVRVHSQLQS